MGRCAGSGGSSGLGRAPLPLARAWLLCQGWRMGTRGAKGVCPGVRKCAPNPAPWGFPTWQEMFPGQTALGGTLAESLWLLKERASVSPSLEQAGTSSACSYLAARWVLWAVQGAAQGARWEARPVGRVLGTLSAVQEPPAHSWRGGSSHWSLPRSVCRARGVCHSTGDIAGSRQCQETREKRAYGWAVPTSCSSSTGTGAHPEPPAQASKPLGAISGSVLTG